MQEPSIVHNNFRAARDYINNLAFTNPDLNLAVNLSPAYYKKPRIKPSTVPFAAPIAQMVEGFVNRQHTVEQVILESIAAAKANADLKGVVYLDEDGAISAARASDAALRDGKLSGPLHGIPITVKDIMHVAGMPTRAGSLAYNQIASIDATAVARLRAAGAIILAKVATHEFALGVTTPQAKNPWDPKRIPGGSSGGSAIALVKGIGMGSLGTDTRASIRVPSALSGVVGFKATFGNVDTAGVVTLSWTMDHVAPMATNSADAALLMDVISNKPKGLSGYVGAKVDGLRIGVPDAAFEDADPDVAAVVERAIKSIGELGGIIIPVRQPTRSQLELANLAGLIVSRCEALAYHRSIGTDLSKCWDETREQLEEAMEIPASEYLAAQRSRSALIADMLSLFEDVDALAMPTSLVTAPLIPEAQQYLMTLARNCIPWSFVGFPSISVPCKELVNGLPVGLQIVAPPQHEAVLVGLATAYERYY
ncbi:MAG: amidase [Dehalococcoidia bacterium]|nr:amidase [Dehalococcoidia bacterium]